MIYIYIYVVHILSPEHTLILQESHAFEARAELCRHASHHSKEGLKAKVENGHAHIHALSCALTS
jgi:hypothetical protein